MKKYKFLCGLVMTFPLQQTKPKTPIEFIDHQLRKRSPKFHFFMAVVLPCLLKVYIRSSAVGTVAD